MSIEGTHAHEAHHLADLSLVDAPQIARRAKDGAVCLVPTGSTEQHGSHLPVGTDAFIARQVSLLAAALAESDVLVAPPIWTGYSPHHVAYGPTVTIGSGLLHDLLREVSASLVRWFDRSLILFVNGHGGNRGALTNLQISGEIRAVSYWDLIDGATLVRLAGEDKGSIGHAGQVETSLMMALAPERIGAVTNGFEPLESQSSGSLELPALGSTGVIGNPHAASESIGSALLGDVVTNLAAKIDNTVAEVIGNRP